MCFRVITPDVPPTRSYDMNIRTGRFRPAIITLGAALLLVCACAKSEDDGGSSAGGGTASSRAQAFQTATKFFTGEPIPADIIISDRQYDESNAKADIG